MGDDMVFYAFRYCLGRRSYAVGICVDYLKKHWKSLTGKTKTMIHQEIKTAFLNEQYGMDMDKQDWEQILSLEV